MFGVKKLAAKLRRYGNGLCFAHVKIAQLRGEVVKLKNSMAALIRQLDRLERARRADADVVNGWNVCRIVEDLRARMPKGSLVNDKRHDDLAARVAKLEAPATLPHRRQLSCAYCGLVTDGSTYHDCKGGTDVRVGVKAADFGPTVALESDLRTIDAEVDR